MPVHVHLFSRGGSITITDATNAEKRGKSCDVIGVYGSDDFHTEHDCRKVSRFLVDWATGLDTKNVSFAECEQFIRAYLSTEGSEGDLWVEGKWGVNRNHTIVIEKKTIRGVDFPKEVLTAGVDGKWSGSAGDDGVSLSDEVDQYNLPARATFGQSANAAYKIAKSVWPQVEKAASFDEASRILSDAGCRLHYWCRMD